MKKIYTKPSLLSETFVAENIMTGDDDKKILSGATTLYFDGAQYEVEFDGNNTLTSISFDAFKL